MQENVTFNRGSHFEERLIQCLMVDHDFAEQMVEVLNPEYFSIEYLKKICKTLFVYYEKYKSFPSIKTLSYIVNKHLEGSVAKDQINEFFSRIKKEPLNGDLEFIKEEALEFCRKKKLVMALEDSLQKIEDKKFDEIGVIIQKALQQGTEKDLGHNFKEQFEARMLETSRIAVATGWPRLNALLRGGGLAAGELGCICAISGMGKSHILVDLGCAAAKAGKTVVFYTLELNEIDVGNRFDSNLSGVAFDQLRSNKEKVKLAIDSLPGKIIIKSYPAGTASVQTLKSHLNRLKVNDIIPDLILVDYADLMKLQTSSEDVTTNAAQIFKELKGFATEIKLPVYSATQANREAIDEEVITAKHIASAYAKIWVCDLFLTFHSPRKQSGVNFSTRKIGNMFICKSRLGPDSIILSSVLDTSTSALQVVEFQEVQQISGNEMSIEEKLRSRLKEISKETKNTLN